jgi:transcription termination/antitermination protein NusA
VYRFEKGTIVVDLLGKAEGVLLKSEQCPKEEFKQGQRVRAFVLEVRKENKGAQIILSRRHQNFVKKLFELEVPEIYEGIVEVKAIARLAGDRTKIAVYSKDEKVDSVGACVGMRGSRVKNIVTELSGEKIDIVRYQDDIREYIKEALKPAEVSEIKLDKAAKRAEVIVADDQLSLAIGKHGQNVRLASKLVDWELDVRTRESAAREALKAIGLGPEEKTQKEPAAPAAQEPAVAAPVAGMSLEQLDGVGEKTMANLKEAGFASVEDIAAADPLKLVEVKGIGEKKAHTLIKEAKKLLHKK